jgi:hypothetical protein
MKHTYELRKLENDNISTTTVLTLVAEPKIAKQKAADYANSNPGLYTLRRVETVGVYFTEINEKK